jgi:hypothetical protein
MKGRIAIQWIISLLLTASLLGIRPPQSGVDAAFQPPQSPANSWNALNKGLNGTVYDIFVDGPDVYVGGSFTATADGATTLNGIARWNSLTSNWHALGSGTVGIAGSNHTVYAIDVVGTDVYVGGDFTSAGGLTTTNLAIWDMAADSWIAIDDPLDPVHPVSPLNGVVYTLAHQGKDVYVGGNFTDAGGSDGDYLVRWDTVMWNSILSELNGTVNVIKIVGPGIYIGGDFHIDGLSHPYDHIAYALDGYYWEEMGSGLNDTVYDIEVIGASVYAGGSFTNTGGNVDCDAIARWDGSSWQPVACGLTDDTVNDLVVVGNDIYAGGGISAAGSSGGPNFLAQWNGAQWSGLGSGVGSMIYPGDLWLEGSRLYAGGAFTDAGGNPEADRIAYWDITESDPDWFALQAGLNGDVEAMAVVGPDVYVGGAFTTAGGISAANYIARWDGTDWHALGNGLNGTVYAIEAIGPDLYVGGAFTNAGSNVNTEADYIARWDMIDNDWNAVGADPFEDPPITGGTDGTVYALGITSMNLFVGGAFHKVGGLTSSEHLVYIDLSNGPWKPWSYGLPGVVYALKGVSKYMYAGGDFTGTASDYILRYDWEEYDWAAVGGSTDLNGPVYTIDVTDETLYAGGAFSSAGGDTTAAHLAGFNGSNWYSLGSTNGPVNTISVIGPDLCIGGDFTNAGGVEAADYIACKNDSGWHALGNGLSNKVNAIVQMGTDMFVGGEFSDAGAVPEADFVARFGKLLLQYFYLPLMIRD